ncbi:MAG: hypothetical protein QGH42_05565 [Kiritimatiellia bacterium]|jgi:hypothetical protein|nr:hypothetical protein [Kiritimatiellia bacterium]MDP6630114.1 hypothetical protein [Kiritimatiellia bacterium]MDP6810615.1 hypothetical protein [Kiritimatiellia bacterium]MDP7023700.1 hypothetical protein [Kiritimatiellia bacterium]
MTRPPDNIPASPDPSRERLSRWLVEWELLNALTSETAGETKQPAGRFGTPLPLANEIPVQAGDIRLLHPRFEPDAPRYVAVVANTDMDTWLVIPFGLLSEPATPGEVVTGRNAPALRVLCPWNRFSMSTLMLERCWLADRLTDKEADWCRSTRPPDRVGPPLRHPLDPRWDYLEMESEFRQRVCSRSRGGITYEIAPPSELQKAAEDGVPYGDESDETEPGDEPGDA